MKFDTDINVGDEVYCSHTVRTVKQIDTKTYLNEYHAEITDIRFTLCNGSICSRSKFRNKLEYRNYLIDIVNELNEK